MASGTSRDKHFIIPDDWQAVRQSLRESTLNYIVEQERLLSRLCPDASWEAGALEGTNGKASNSLLEALRTRGAEPNGKSALKPTLGLGSGKSRLTSAAAAFLETNEAASGGNADNGETSGSAGDFETSFATTELSHALPDTPSGAPPVQVATPNALLRISSSTANGSNVNGSTEARLDDRVVSNISAYTARSEEERQSERATVSEGYLAHPALSSLLDGSFSLKQHLLNNRFGQMLLDVWNYPEPEREGLLANIVTNRYFDVVCVVVILLNAVYLVYMMNDAVKHFEDPNYSNFGDTVVCIEFAFLSFYFVELMLKIWVHKIYFLFGPDASWNILDVILVALSLIDIVTSLLQDGSEVSSSGVTYLRTLRLLKVSKILRVVRVVRFVGELRVLLDCLTGCVSSLFWSMTLMAFMLGMFSMFFVQASTNFLMQNGQEDPIVTNDLLRMFGSVEHGMLTLFMATTGGDDWSNAFLAIEKTGTANGAVFVFFISIFTVALWNIVTSMFIDRAMRAAAKNIECLAYEKQKEDLQDAKDFVDMFGGLDLDGNNTISLEEFHTCMQKPKFRTYFEVRGLDVRDATAFYRMVQEVYGKHGEDMCVSEFASACLRLRGSASNLDQQISMVDIKTMLRKLVDMDRKHRHRLQKLEDTVSKASGLKNLPSVDAESSVTQAKPSKANVLSLV